MKRCPQCSFLYLDTDEVCDLDGTPLVQVNDADVEAATAPIPAIPEQRKKSGSRKGLIITAVAKARDAGANSSASRAGSSHSISI